MEQYTFKFNICSKYVTEEIIIAQKWMHEIKAIIFMKIPSFELSKNETKNEKLAVWSTGVVFHILTKAQLHKTHQQAF